MGSPVAAPGAVEGIAERLAGLRVAREGAPAPAPGCGDITARLAQLSVARP
uniref:Uncharacterized protein n=1 Tax=Arundo donax TaxID=35708 RepID=A0A0A9G6W6_ARUDO